MNKCENCLNSRIIISENGYKSICALSDKYACECILGYFDYYAAIPNTQNKRQEEREGE